MIWLALVVVALVVMLKFLAISDELARARKTIAQLRADRGQQRGAEQRLAHYQEQAVRWLSLAEWRLQEAFLWRIRGSDSDPKQIAQEAYDRARQDLAEHDAEQAGTEAENFHLKHADALDKLKAERDGRDLEDIPYRPISVEELVVAERRFPRIER